MSKTQIPKNAIGWLIVGLPYLALFIVAAMGSPFYYLAIACGGMREIEDDDNDQDP